jgi:integrase
VRGQGRVFKRSSGKFFIAYYGPKPTGEHGEIRERAGDREKDAERLLKARLRELAIHRAGLRNFLGPGAERVTVAEILTGLERDYEVRGRKSLGTTRSHLKPVRAFFGLDRALAVTSARLRDYIAHRQQEGAAASTINRETELIRRAFALAVETDLLAMAPKVPRLPEHNARQGFVERGEFEAILKNLQDPDVQDFCEWFWWTGMRPGEIRSLEWNAFDKETGTLRLHAKDAKTGYGRVIALEGPLRAIIERRLKARRLDCPVIFHRQGRPMGEFRKRWKRACAAAGVPTRLLYDLRRTAVRNMIRAGVDPAVAMRISGHRTRAIFDRYNIIDERDLREAMAKTSAYVEGLPSDRTVVPLAGIMRTAE